MPFFPDTGFGLSYLAALCIASALSWYGGANGTRPLVVIMIVHWVTMRGIDVYDHNSFWLWTVQDIAMIAALAVVSKSIHGYAMAYLYFGGLFFDQWSLFTGGGFEPAAAVAETIGYLSMLIMLGGAFNGKHIFGGDRGKRRSGVVPFSVEKWGAISTRSGMPYPHVSDVHFMAQKNGLK